MRAPAGLCHTQIAGCFNRGLGRRHRVRLIGGGEEPLYQPAEAFSPATIRYTRDYAASALHELAHWCIAGATRRQKLDYGYWYRPPPRTPQEQAAFCKAELRVQALELRFAEASGLPFRVSADDLDGSPAATRLFEKQVVEYAMTQFCPDGDSGLPDRAARLYADLGRLRRQLFPADLQRAGG